MFIAFKATRRVIFTWLICLIFYSFSVLMRDKIINLLCKNADTGRIKTEAPGSLSLDENITGFSRKRSSKVEYMEGSGRREFGENKETIVEKLCKDAKVLCSCEFC